MKTDKYGQKILAYQSFSRLQIPCQMNRDDDMPSQYARTGRNFLSYLEHSNLSKSSLAMTCNYHKRWILVHFKLCSYQHDEVENSFPLLYQDTVLRTTWHQVFFFFKYLMSYVERRKTWDTSAAQLSCCNAHGTFGWILSSEAPTQYCVSVLPMWQLEHCTVRWSSFSVCSISYIPNIRKFVRTFLWKIRNGWCYEPWNWKREFIRNLQW